MHTEIERLHSAVKEICHVAELAGEKVAVAACHEQMAHHTDAVVKHTEAATMHGIEEAHHGLGHGGTNPHRAPSHP